MSDPFRKRDDDAVGFTVRDTPRRLGGRVALRAQPRARVSELGMRTGFDGRQRHQPPAPPQMPTLLLIDTVRPIPDSLRFHAPNGRHWPAVGPCRSKALRGF